MKYILIFSMFLLISCNERSEVDSSSSTQGSISTECIDHIVYDVYLYGKFIHFNPNRIAANC